MNCSRWLYLFAIVLNVLSAGCSTMHKPEDLRQPTSVSCFRLPTPVSYQEERGPFNIVWETRLESGLYVAEREDEQGTYYRGPRGVFYEGRPELRHEKPGLATHIRRDGGVWIPHDSTHAPRLYIYLSTSDAPVEASPKDESCSSLAVIKDPATSGYSVVAFAAGGAVGGALGRAMAPGSSVSYGAASIGGAIGMGIVAAMINMDVGKIALLNPLKDASFVAKINSAFGRATVLEEIPRSEK